MPDLFAAVAREQHHSQLVCLPALGAGGSLTALRTADWSAAADHLLRQHSAVTGHSQGGKEGERVANGLGDGGLEKSKLDMPTTALVLIAICQCTAVMQHQNMGEPNCHESRRRVLCMSTSILSNADVIAVLERQHSCIEWCCKQVCRLTFLKT